MLLSDDEVYIWIINLENNKKLYDYGTILNANDYKKSAEFTYKKHRNKFLLRRSILKLIISKYINVAPLEIVILYTKNNKPYIENAIHFNTSYTNEYLTIGIAKDNIGIDIEDHKGLMQSYDTLKLFMSENEISTYALLKKSEQENYIYNIWSAKEAVLKLLGTGFFMDPTKITIDLNSKKANILNTDKPIYLHRAKRVYIATSFYIHKIRIKDIAYI